VSKPAAHVAQLALALYLAAQKEQLAPVHDAAHVHAQPVRVLPLTLVAWLLQLSATVQVSAQLG
jgi:hypothetical protein